MFFASAKVDEKVIKLDTIYNLLASPLTLNAINYQAYNCC